MRIRTIKPEFWHNEDLCELSCQTRLLAIALLNWSDDEGYFKASPKIIEGSIFPISVERPIVDCLKDLVNIKYIEIFIGSDDRHYGKVVNFATHQVINKQKTSKIKSLIPSTVRVPYEYRTDTVRVPYVSCEGKNRTGEKTECCTLAEIDTNPAFEKVSEEKKSPGKVLNSKNNNLADDTVRVPYEYRTDTVRVLQGTGNREQGTGKGKEKICALAGANPPVSKLEPDEISEPEKIPEKKPEPENHPDQILDSENTVIDFSDKPAAGRKPKQAGNEIVEVWQYYRDKIKKYNATGPPIVLPEPRSCGTAAKKHIGAALNRGYSVADCCEAVDGILELPHNIGLNENKKAYVDLELLMRDGKLDGYIATARRNPAVHRYSTKQLQNAMVLEKVANKYKNQEDTENEQNSADSEIVRIFKRGQALLDNRG